MIYLQFKQYRPLRRFSLFLISSYLFWVILDANNQFKITKDFGRAIRKLFSGQNKG